ncbi:MAG TPA: YfcE family phosphodiesterase [Pseudomonadales bacterium]
MTFAAGGRSHIGPMRIGIVSDTHNNLRNVHRIVELFNAAGVDRVIHTGDITQAKTLDVFAHLDAPLYGVFGNNDQEREALEAAIARYGFRFCEPPFELDWHERRIVVVHDPLELEGVLGPEHALALHGHTHLYRYEQRGGQVLFNPGECAGHMKGLNAVGVMDLSDLSVELLRF